MTLPPVAAYHSCFCVPAQIELQYGSVYEKYRCSCYFWQCMLMLEAFLMALLLVMLQTQHNPALQVLVAMAIMFAEAVLQVRSPTHTCLLLLQCTQGTAGMAMLPGAGTTPTTPQP